MAADEELWRTLYQFAAYAWVVFAWITANVLHQYLHLLTLEAQHFGKHTSQFGTVAIAIYGTQGAYGSQLLCHFGRAEVATMPYLIAWFEILAIAFVPKRVGVADYTNTFHLLAFSRCLHSSYEIGYEILGTLKSEER